MNSFWTGFGIGLLGSFHCVGMCGPIILSLQFNKGLAPKQLLGNTLYQFGRIFTYVLLGVIVGLVGRGFSLAGFQQPLSVSIGILLILIILLPRLGLNIPILQNLNSFTGFSKLFSHGFKRKNLWGSTLSGMINGLLPCGLVYLGLFSALATGSVSEGAVLMAGFGWGTFFLMFSVGMAGGFIPQKIRFQLQKAIPVVVVIMGLLFVVRGLGLDVNYLSPPKGALQIEATEDCH